VLLDVVAPPVALLVVTTFGADVGVLILGVVELPGVRLVVFEIRFY